MATELASNALTTLEDMKVMLGIPPEDTSTSLTSLMAYRHGLSAIQIFSYPKLPAFRHCERNQQ